MFPSNIYIYIEQLNASSENLIKDAQQLEFRRTGLYMYN